ncbi:MAG: esterase family protein, partial [Armatimonadetes bacterium]|nr:esterase family protein [Armatimonadota bacterium]
VLYFDCGAEDERLPHNRDFRRRLSSLRIRHDFTEPRGGHDWTFWDQRLPSSLAFIAHALGISSD